MFEGGVVPAELALLDPALFSADERIAALLAVARAHAQLAAFEQRTLAVHAVDLSESATWMSTQENKSWVREELALASTVSCNEMANRLAVAQTLVERLPRTLGALERGGLDYYRCRLIAEACYGLDDATATAVEAQVLIRAGQQTPAALRRSLKRVIARLAPQRLEERHRDAIAERGVWANYPGDGTGQLFATASADRVRAIMALVETAAADKQPGETRTADQRRSDALMDLASGGVHAKGPSIIVTVGLSTLVGEDDLPAELERGGLIPASLARKIANDPTGTWRRLITDPTGHVRDYGRRRYRPPTDLTEHVQMRDQHCRFPGCGRRAKSCDIDHLQPWDDNGKTNQHNLHLLCPRHHHLKHEAGWTVNRNARTGVTTWRTPHGRTYQTHPPDLPGPNPISYSADSRSTVGAGRTDTTGHVADRMICCALLPSKAMPIGERRRRPTTISSAPISSLIRSSSAATLTASRIWVV